MTMKSVNKLIHACDREPDGYIIVRNRRGQELIKAEAYRTDIIGLFVTRIPNLPWLWTVSHWSGLNFGGMFKSIDDAREAIANHFKHPDVRRIDWRTPLKDLIKSKAAEIIYRTFRAKYNLGIAPGGNEVAKLKRLTPDS